METRKLNYINRARAAIIGKSIFTLIVFVAAALAGPAQAQRNNLVSINQAGTDSGNQGSAILPPLPWSPQRIDFSSSFVTPDGRFVVFQSVATDLTADRISTGSNQVYVRDLGKGTTKLVSVNRDGTGGGNSSSGDAVISSDGRFVAFVSFASDLVERDTNEQSDIFVRDLVAETTKLVSVNHAGTDSGRGNPTLSNGAPLKPDFLSFWHLMSTDGRRVVFQSYDDDLVENDTNNALDIFVRDMQTGRTSCISVNRAGVPTGNRTSISVSGFFFFDPVLSADGRYVAFVSWNNDHVDNDTVCADTCNGTNGLGDVFVRDLEQNKTILVSVNRHGTSGSNGFSADMVISADGRFVAFGSEATDLVPNNFTRHQANVYVRDMQVGVTTLVSVSRTVTDGTTPNSSRPLISADGRFIAFSSASTDLAPNKTDVIPLDVFVRDVKTGMTTLVSVNRNGNNERNTNSFPRYISHDGRFIVFFSSANDLVLDDNDGGDADVFVRDLAIGTTFPLNLNLTGNISSSSGAFDDGRISTDGRTLVFKSIASDLVENDTNNTRDVFARAVHPPYVIDDPQFFVAQHYRDFLSREPDPAGLAFWTNEITSCGADVQCQEVKRINVSAAFFLSIEFQESGYFVYRVYQAAFNTGERLRRADFLPDTQGIGAGVIVGQSGWELRLVVNKQRFADEFVKRPRFTAAYPGTMTPAQFVDALNANTGGSLSQSERDALVSDLDGGRKTRTEVLRAVAEDADFVQREFNRAFVLMEYFGYLRRNPNDAPDTDYTGYDFWLNKLNLFNGNSIDAEMVKAFISSTEYRQRFGS